MNLALATGNVSPRKMLRGMSLRELGMWAAMWNVDPWGQERADLRSGMIAYVIAESKRHSKVRSTPYTPLDFMPYAKRDKASKERELGSRLRAVFKGMANRPKKKG